MIELANQFGLYGITSVLLGLVAILLAVGGVFAFLHVRRSSRKIAKAEARRVAESISERVAVAYLQREVPDLISQYMELAKGAVGDDHATEVADTQDNGG